MRKHFTRAAVPAFLSLVLCCTACGKTDTPAENQKTAPPAATTAAAETTPAAPKTTTASSSATTTTQATAATTTTTTTAASAETEPEPEPAEDLSKTVPPDYTVGVGEPRLYDVAPIAEAYRTGDRSALDETDCAILDKAAEILAEVTNEDMSDYEKELAVHDYMIVNCTYDHGALAVISRPSEHSDDPYGALINGSAICSGYSTAFKLFMDMLGIPCETVYYLDPKNSSHDHAWNIVEINGAKLYVDVTWDDPTPDKNPDRLTRHFYFNVSRQVLERDHELSDDCPDTPDLKDAYASHELSPEPNSTDELTALVAAAMEKDTDMVCFIPTEGGIWQQNLTLRMNDVYLISDLKFEAKIGQSFRKAGCRFYRAEPVNTDKGEAVCLRLYGNKAPRN